ncbi:O-methyltransferase-domain-containing protein [Phaeosphaeriaceae sp. PMI808]|nr:O-methyltransferase-domain-containing protein [Phaeosphaeriaceae sp. PMI808]
MDDSQDVSIATLAQRISALSSQITSYYSANSLPSPNFTPNAPATPETPEYEALRGPLNDAALDLLRLVNGPKNTLQQLFFSQYDIAAMQVALDKRFFESVPLPSEASKDADSLQSSDKSPKASVEDIAKKANMDVNRTSRVLKMLATHRIFAEVESKDDGEAFTHTAGSALLARDSGFYAVGEMCLTDMFPAASASADAITASPFLSDASHSPFSQRYGGSMYKYFEQHPEKAQRFGKAMGSWSQFDRQISELHNGFPWASLGNGTVVDIGGGSGHISVGLARSFPSLKFIVQDISAHMLPQSQDEDISSRITFQTYDFFTPQPVHSASESIVFLLRQCLHNNNDDDAIKIIQQIVPALERSSRGTRLLINDVVLPDRDVVTRSEEHYLRQIDVCMMVTLGAKQRSESEWKKLIKAADERLEVMSVRRSPIGLGLVEIALKVE